MFKVDTPQGERYMVQLVGPSSYRMGNLMAYRGQTLTVTKRTRDYLVRKTDGAWVDFDPTPAEPIDEVMPPQFGEPGGPSIDMDDIDPAANPPMSMDHAMQLAQGGGEVPTNAPQAGPVPVVNEGGIDTADLAQAPEGVPETPDESGDLTKEKLAQGAAPATGGASATAPKKPAAKPAPKAAGGVKITTKAKPKAEAAMTVE